MDRKYVVYNSFLEKYAYVFSNDGTARNSTMMWVDDIDKALVISDKDVDWIQKTMDTGYYMPYPGMTREWSDQVFPIISKLVSEGKHVYKTDPTLESWRGIWYLGIDEDTGQVIHDELSGEFDFTDFRGVIVESVEDEMKQAALLHQEKLNKEALDHSSRMQKFAEEFYKEFEEKFGVKEAKVDDYL